MLPKEEVQLHYSHILPQDLSGLQKQRLVPCWPYMSTEVHCSPALQPLLCGPAHT